MKKATIHLDRKLTRLECLVAAIRMRCRPKTVREIEAAAHVSHRKNLRYLTDLYLLKIPVMKQSASTTASRLHNVS